MNKIHTAWAALQSLPPREQEIAAEAILDFVASESGPHLSDAQAREMEQRLADENEPTVTPAELRAQIAKRLR